MFVSTAPLVLGAACAAGNTRLFSGLIDEPVLYPTRLTDNEIKRIFAKGHQ
jgi:hypothetical protein